MVMRTCGVCKTEIDLNEHQSGFVFDDKIFVCQECCQKNDHHHDDWPQSVMQKQGNCMPIGLWLIHEQNKDKRMFSKQKF